jgi:hypothetical protein
MRLILILVLINVFWSCQKKESKSSSSTTVDPVSTSGGISGSVNGGSTTSGTTTSGTTTSGSTTGGAISGFSCSGDASDGVGSGLQLGIFDLTLAGYQNWFPGQVSGSPYWIPTVQESSLLFATDSRLKVRFKVLPQPIAPAPINVNGNLVYTEYCHGRQTGMAGDPFNYTKVRLKVALRDVLLNGSTYSLGAPYQHRIIDPISANYCSPVIDFSTVRNASAVATVVEVSEVKSDSTCQNNGTLCPAEAMVRRASCWSVKMQLATDQTQNLP